MERQPAARPPRQRGRLLAVLTALPLVLGLLATTAPPARSATTSGYDISWPQCPVSAGGYGLPMPPTTTPFVVVGPDQGAALHQNPCLAEQVGGRETHGRPAQAYTMAAFPTAAQLSAYRSKGPWSARTRAGQLSNVGWSEAAYAVASLRGPVLRRRWCGSTSSRGRRSPGRPAPRGSSGRTATSSRA